MVWLEEEERAGFSPDHPEANHVAFSEGAWKMLKARATSAFFCVWEMPLDLKGC